MTRRKQDPSYRCHKQSGQAVVTLPDGLGGRRDVLLGKYNTDESQTEYDRVFQEWRANGRRPPTQPVSPEGNTLTFNELLLAYLNFAQSYCVKDGKPTSEVAALKAAMRFVFALDGHIPEAEFSPRCLKAVRQTMIEHPITVKVKTKVKTPGAGTVRIEEREKLLRNGPARKCVNKQVGRVKRIFAWAVEKELVPVPVYQTLTCVKGLKRAGRR
jgi:hypothetical protein